jgi:hypothetical protein
VAVLSFEIAAIQAKDAYMEMVRKIEALEEEGGEAATTMAAAIAALPPPPPPQAQAL